MKASHQSTDPMAEPTRSELEILKVLWQIGPATVRAVNNKINEQIREVNYTSTLKLMQIMLEKGFLARNDESMTHIYSAAAPEQKTKGELLEKFVSNLFEGSASKMMMQLLGNKKTSQQELDAIRSFLNDMDKK
jgi:predicted transcriptional regulator